MYTWAQNKNKLTRAIGTVGTTDEAKLKAEYIKIGGFVLGDEVAAEKTVADVSLEAEVTEEVVAKKTKAKK